MVNQETIKTVWNISSDQLRMFYVQESYQKKIPKIILNNFMLTNSNYSWNELDMKLRKQIEYFIQKQCDSIEYAKWKKHVNEIQNKYR